MIEKNIEKRGNFAAVMQNYRNTITNEELKELPLGSYEGRVEVIETVEALEEACRYLLGCPVVGFDTETKPSFKAGVTNKVSLIQLSTDSRCFLFRICRTRLEKMLLKVLESPKVLKVGVDVGGDIRNLLKVRRFRPAGFVELQQEVTRFGIEDKSLRKIAGIVLGCAISKAQRLSNWESHTLTPAQVRYAATDAWICLRIYRQLFDNEQ